MKEISYFMTAGAFVYLGLGLQAKCGDAWYFGLVIAALVVGYFIR